MVDLLGPQAPPARPPVLTVSQLNARVKGLLEEEFGDLLVEGEVSSWRLYPSGHAYFDLKDAAAKAGAVMFAGRRRFLRFQPEDGMRVLTRCRVTLYERDGRFQLSVLSMEPLGEGALEIAFRQLHQRLAQEGLFDPARKCPLPERPRRVALVTSREGAAVQDMLRVLRERAPIVEVVVVHTQVQGEGAAASIASALRRADRGLARLGRPADLIIVGRGGGSREDLWAFNEEEAVRAVAACGTPVLSAVGHEIDTTLTDLAADESAPTPTAAAERAARGWAALSREVQRIPGDLLRLLRLRLEEGEERLAALGRERVFRRPEAGLDALGQRMDGLFDRLWRETRHAGRARASALAALLPRLRAASPRRRVRQGWEGLIERLRRLIAAQARLRERKEAALAAGAGRLEAVSPLAVLARGYSLAYRERDGALLREAAQAAPGDRVRLRLHRGTLACRVEEARAEARLEGGSE
ncbi:MAG: exodeoxyribonuclease VII large subunit [Candidatus Tectomicrobia bacterium RIFCSPLOWO2_12_FULL_69_37]|nr:MAG: exodeoxyribonuclease VII large subunit [Candidatus Tectomicrobia bacterium RIFCSPLOWO2_12_FULL_69_37]